MAELVYAMPSMGADMEHGTIIEWLVGPGDTVHRGDIVARIDTDKADVDAEIWLDGVIAELLAQVGEQLPVGAPLARLAPVGAVLNAPRDGVAAIAAHHSATYSPLVRHDAERLGLDLSQIEGSGQSGALTRKDIENISQRVQAPPVAPPQPRTQASPLARRLAQERGVDLLRVVGSGPGGAILAADVSPAATAPRAPSVPMPSTAPAQIERRARVRRATAELMARSKREIPHYYLTLDVNLGPALAMLTELNLSRPPASRILPAALLAQAVAHAALEVADLNGHWVDEGFRPAEGVQLGIAVSMRGGGLVAPTLRDAGVCSLEELMAQLRDVVGRARRGSLRSSEMAPPSITVTNLGDQGVDSVLPIIVPPQVSMVGFGRIREQPWAINGMLTVRPVVTVTLAADHRASDGHTGARFLTAIANHLAESATRQAEHERRPA